MLFSGCTWNVQKRGKGGICVAFLYGTTSSGMAKGIWIDCQGLQCVLLALMWFLKLLILIWFSIILTLYFSTHYWWSRRLKNEKLELERSSWEVLNELTWAPPHLQKKRVCYFKLCMQYCVIILGLTCLCTTQLFLLGIRVHWCLTNELF